MHMLNGGNIGVNIGDGATQKMRFQKIMLVRLQFQSERVKLFWLDINTLQPNRVAGGF